MEFPLTIIHRGIRLGLLCSLLVWLASPAPVHAQAHGLEVRPADQELISQEPRQVVTTVFRVRNGTGQAGSFEARSLLPPGWRLITPEFPFELAAGATTLRFVSFFIPENAAAGDHPFTYEVIHRRQPAIRDAYTLRVQVLPVLKLQVNPLESPDFVVSGDPYQAAFLIQNSGNTTITVEYKLTSSRSNSLQPGTGTVTLKAGEARRVAVEVKTGAIQRPERDSLTLTAQIVGKEVSERQTSTTEVLPRVTGAEQRFNTIPATLGLGYVMRDQNGKRSAGWQVDLAGAGTLDEAGEHNIAFRVRGPDIQSQIGLGLQDEYWVEYWSANFKLSLGDRLYALSPLTESGRYGRGARVGYALGGLRLDAYHMEDRQTSNPTQQTAVSASHPIGERIRLGVNYLDKQGGESPGTVASLRGQLAWAPALTVDFEFARSEGDKGPGQAVRGQLFDRRGGLRYYASVLYADPEFSGYYRDQEYKTFGFDYPLTEQWSVRGHYRTQRHNLDAAPDRPAPDEQEISVGTEYRLATDTRIGLDYRQRTREDQRAAPEFDSTFQGARVSVSQRLKTLSLTASGEWGITEDDIKNNRSAASRYTLSAHWRPTDRQTYGGYVFYDDNTYSDSQDSARTTVGLNAGYRLSKASSLDLNLQRSLNQHQDYDTYNVRVHHQLKNNHQLGLTARHSTGNSEQTDVLLTYTIPFGMPISRKKDVATLRGRIYDAETGQGLANVVLNLGGLVAISEAKGDFTFPSVKLGTHHLAMGRASAALDNKVSVNPLPLQVEIRYGADNRVEIPLTRGATLSGQVMVYAPPEEMLPSQGFVQLPAKAASSPASPEPRQKLAPSHGLQNILVVLRNGERVFKRLTDASGGFRLAGLPPGQWTVGIEKDGLPANMALEQKQFVLDIAPGGEASIEFKLVPKIRKMKMLEPLKGLLMGAL